MPSWFDAEVADLARRTRPRQGERNLILFYGSSTFTLWHDLAASFPAHNVVNHGFGGATLADCVEYFDQLVTPLGPSAVILYAGDNDLDQGATPEAVCANVLEFLHRMRRSLPEVPVAYVSIKVSPARFPIMHKIGYTNLIIGRALASEAGVSFVDVTRRMVSRGLVSLVGCYSDDPLHMNARGYRIWTATLHEYLARLEQSVGPLAVRAVPAGNDLKDGDAVTGIVHGTPPLTPAAPREPATTGLLFTR